MYSHREGDTKYTVRCRFWAHVCMSRPISVGVGSTAPFPTPSRSLLSLPNKAVEKIFVTGLRDFLPERLIKKNQLKTDSGSKRPSYRLVPASAFICFFLVLIPAHFHIIPLNEQRDNQFEQLCRLNTSRKGRLL